MLHSNPLSKYLPQKYVSPHLQWHVTERCNLRCQHCYQDSYNSTELEYSDLLETLDQFRCFILFHRKQQGRKINGHITLTGGEPFARHDFMDLLERIHQLRDFFTFSILSNGTLVDDAVASKLGRLDTKYFQVSLDGDQKRHDALRGDGNFEDTLAAIDRLKSHDIKVMVSFTANKSNYQSLPMVAEACGQHAVDYLWSDRMLPEGTAENISDYLLSAKETREYVEILARLAKKYSNTTGMQLKTHRALQFLTSDKPAYSCTAGRSLITIMHNGDLVPCRRMPIVVGNILDRPLTQLYLESPILRELRSDQEISGCESCEHKASCRGGLKCLSYAIHGDHAIQDPGCWLGKHSTSLVNTA